jgi:predicted TIM-barrel fold metal-dependent hydrolase
VGQGGPRAQHQRGLKGVNASIDGPAGWDCHVHVFDGSETLAGAHYRPASRPLHEIELVAQAHGCGHLVLVQPSVCGTDNSLLLQALTQSAGRHRGVVVLHGDESDAELDAMHAAGVRGVRFNLVSPVGTAREDVELALARLAPRLRGRRWHVQWYVQPSDLPQLIRMQADCRLVFVLDHLAGMTPAHVEDAAAWHALNVLRRQGAWIKLSGWYRLQAEAPYDALQPLVRRMVSTFGTHMVWGSDWPHTSFEAHEAPAYASLWQPVVRALGGDAARTVREAGGRLYA